jgi:tRNA(Ile)-lysidine synthetase, N-terminal domain/tRNA(Ile)-lysidine synthetase, C-terminal domain
MLQQKVLSYIEKHQLLSPEEAVIIGVSGGTDSVVLLHILISLGYKCEVAHCNFHLRMEESMYDEKFVRKLAQTYDIPLHTIDFDTITYAKDHGISIEMAARELRYDWFEKIMTNQKAQATAVAHHADDNIETLLLNLSRGTGLRGLCGMSVRNNNIVRPLLECSREEIENYLNEYRLEHVEDSTNALNDYKRNKIRNEVIPMLSKLNPAIRETLGSEIRYFNGTLAIYEQALKGIKKEIVDNSENGVKLNIDKIKKQVDIPTIMFELLHPFNFNNNVIGQITEHLDGESGKIFHSVTHRLIKDRNYLIIKAKGHNEKNIFILSQEDSELYIPNKLTIKKLQKSGGYILPKERNTAHIDAAKISFPLTIRNWQEGDFFYPLGMKKKKKVSDFFIDNKLPLFEKENVQLLVSNNEIVWIIGRRLDDRFKITDDTTNIIELIVE